MINLIVVSDPWQYQGSETTKCHKSRHQKEKHKLLDFLALPKIQKSLFPSAHSIKGRVADLYGLGVGSIMERATYDINFEKITPLRRAKCNSKEKKYKRKNSVQNHFLTIFFSHVVN